ncbi:substrate-binding domain-containing protein [Vallitalea pronyensis]|uniref:Substrate-binding domain-containing protein n=1 Tax=Vallitalea pronyensis TaxID=1348613 RepID=A0A8J8SG32_9FIRM|nr:substrate-binding domain-containing protein [Vallitalea pronyensis]QUI22330.1 substrate-binding domain-containing protein [Vallitalea pronyensis]
MDNKRLIYGLILILVVILMGSLIAGIAISNEITKSSKGDYLWDSKERAKEHIMVIIDDANQTYDEAFEKGLLETAATYRIAVEINKIDRTNYDDDVIAALDKAKYAKVNGIIVHAFNDEKMASKIQEISDLGIPVITLDEDVPKSSRICYVGVNRYDIGQLAGESFARLLHDGGKIAVIDQKSYSKDRTINEEMMLLGLREVLKSQPNLSLEKIEYTEQGVLSAETAATKILLGRNDINGIFCTDGENTLGVVQVLIDNNLVNDVVLVGYGNDAEIMAYIEKGNIIEASIVTDHEDIGRQAIEAFIEYRTNQFVSSYINTDIRLIDETNVLDYISEMSDTLDEKE